MGNTGNATARCLPDTVVQRVWDEIHALSWTCVERVWVHVDAHLTAALLDGTIKRVVVYGGRVGMLPAVGKDGKAHAHTCQYTEQE